MLNHNSSIRCLQLEDNKISCVGVSSLCLAITGDGNTSLTSLWLANNDIGNEGLDAIGRSLDEGQNTSLRSLSLSNCGLGAESVSRLGTMLSINRIHLDSLTLTEGSGPQRPIHLVDGDHIASTVGFALGNNTSLTSLSLPNCQLTDSGLGMLCSKLMINRRLQFLNVRGNAITSWGAVSFFRITLNPWKR